MMHNEKKSKSTLIIWSVLVLEVILLFTFAIILSNIHSSALNNMPQQTAQVEAVKKYINKNGSTSKQYRICFKFKDSMEKEFIVDEDAYEIIQENQTGTLFYKAIYPNKKSYERVFIRFEKAPLE